MPILTGSSEARSQKVQPKKLNTIIQNPHTPYPISFFDNPIQSRTEP